MSEDLVEEPFKSAAERVEEEHQQSASELRSKVEKAKSEALKKVSSESRPPSARPQKSP